MIQIIKYDNGFEVRVTPIFVVFVITIIGIIVL